MKYKFIDASHYQGDIDFSLLPNQGIRFVIIKASDGYYMPDRDGDYHYAEIPANHKDAYFEQNFDRARSAGMVATGYHFCRFDRPKVKLTQIPERNFEYFQHATDTRLAFGNRVVLDMEQKASQLKNAGLSPADVTAMAIDYFAIFDEYFGLPTIGYSNASWINQWITKPEIFADRPLWIANYKYINSQNNLLYPWQRPTYPNGLYKHWAWQYTDRAKVNGKNMDMNFYDMEKEELYDFIGQDGAVDPPNPNPTEPCDKPVLISEIDAVLDNHR